MEQADRLKTALVQQLSTVGISLVPKRKSPIMWMAHVLLWPFMKLAGRSFIDDYVTTFAMAGKIFVPVPADQPQTAEQAVRHVSVATLAHELTHVYQSRSGSVMHGLSYLCPQLPILLFALALIPLHAWLASLSGWGHLIIIGYLTAVAFSLTPLVTLIPWHPRFHIEHDAYITSVFTIHALHGHIDRQYVVEHFAAQLAGAPYLWPGSREMASRAAEAAYDRVSRRDPTLHDEPSRRFVKEVLG